MAIPAESLEVQIESPVDFASLNRNKMCLETMISAQELFPYFHMLNGPTYVELVKDFWVRVEVYDEEASMNEEIQAVISNPSLKGKTREEMGLETFKETEIRSAVMGVPITITEEIIAKACRTEASCRFLWNITKKHALLQRYTSVGLKGNPSTKLVDIDPKHRRKIKKFSPHEKDLKESTAPTQLMKDFPPIIKEKNPEVLSKLIAEFVNETGDIMVDDDTPADDSIVPLQVKKRRTISEAGSEASGGQTKKAKGDKSDAPNLAVSSASKKRTKGDSSSLVNQEKLAKAREERAKKIKTVHQKCELAKVKMTPELAKEACEESKRLLAERKKKKEALQAERDAKLKSIGLDGSSDFIEEKLEEVAKISKSVEKLAIKKAVKMLEQILEASEVVASEAAQTSAVPTSNPTLSSSNSDLDDVPISQKLKSLQKPYSTTQQTTLQEEQTSVVVEALVDPEEPKSTDLPTCDSPSNLHSLEKHLGGELQETPEKATISVSKQTDIVNQQQQQPEPSNQTTTEQTSTSTQLTQTQTTHSPQNAIPEPVVETVVPEFVQVTESEQSVAITVSELTKKTNNQSTTNDQPSSSSTIQTTKTTIPHLLKSEVLESAVMNMHAKLQRLV